MTVKSKPWDGVLLEYGQLLGEIDTWFDGCAARYPEQVACRKGCHACCRGLFDITLLDAALLQQGFLALPATSRRNILTRCRQRLASLQQRWPEFDAPWILNRLPSDEWQEMPEEDTTPCPLLADSGLCLVYNHRPMTCRLHGLPNIDASGEDFSTTLCSLNEAIGELAPEGLRWSFRTLFTRELALFGHFTRMLTGTPLQEFDTFIPTALLIDFDATDWPALVRPYSPS